jgi:hypothetical protein
MMKARENKMRSISEILNLAKDGEVPNKQAAQDIIEQEVADRVKICHITEEEARSVIKHNIGYCTGYMTPEDADRINDLFETEHPVWGRTHPTPEEALRLGVEWGERSLKSKENDDDKKASRKTRRTKV